MNALPPKARAGLTAVSRLKATSPSPSRGRDLQLYRLRLKGPKGETVLHFDERTVPKRARPLIAYLSTQSRPLSA